MSDLLLVVPQELSDLRGALTTASTQVAEAESAGATVTSLSPQAFGIICGFFTPPCLAFSTAALAALGQLGSALDKRAEAVSASASDFVETDVRVAAIHDKLRGQVS